MYECSNIEALRMIIKKEKLRTVNLILDYFNV